MAKNDKTKKKTQTITPKFLSIVYICVIIFCIGILATLIVLASIRIQHNAELKDKEAEIVERYNDLATEHENLTDPDYAKVYFDDNVMYIPSEDVIIEYEP